jgi:acetyl esterase
MLIDGIASLDDVAGDPALQERVARFVARTPGYVPPRCGVREVSVDVPGHRLGLRIYRPKASSSVGGVLVWLHGGAFRFGDLDMPEADTVARELVHLAELEVVTVDYRLVRDGIHHPLPLRDVVAAWEWAAMRHAGQGAARMWLGGVSAGATLAVSAALQLRDRSAVAAPIGLVLVSPALHRDLPAPSAELASKVREIPPLARFDAKRCAGMFADYLGPQPAAAPYAVPGECELQHLPPVTIVNGEYDDLRSSGELFAVQLAAAGVPVQVRTEAGVIHGHLNEDPRLPGMARTLAHLAAVVGRVAP